MLQGRSIKRAVALQSAGSKRRYHQHPQGTSLRVLIGQISSLCTRTVRSTAGNSFKLKASPDDASDASKQYLNMFQALSSRQRKSESLKGKLPALEDIVRKFCPLFVFHPKENYVCCTEEYFADCRQLGHAMDDAPAESIMEQLQKQLLEHKKKQQAAEKADEASENDDVGPGLRMDIIERKDRVDSVDVLLAHLPVFAKIRRGKLTTGESILDITYIALMAYSGPVRVYLGAHNGGCERITMRCTTAGHLIAVYYGSHKDQEGTWVPAKDCPVDGNTGRLMGFLGLHGNGVYHTTGIQERPEAFFRTDDTTSSEGRVWGSKKCLILGYPEDDEPESSEMSYEKLEPVLKDRGCEYTEGYEGEPNIFSPALTQRNDEPVKAADVVVDKHSFLSQKARLHAVLRPARQGPREYEAEEAAASTDDDMTGIH